MEQQDKTLDSLAEILGNTFKTLHKELTNPSFWALSHLGIDLYDNQIEIINVINDLDVKYLSILAARGSGKTFATSLGIIKLCLDIPGFKVGVFGPKADQANRIVKEITNEIITPSSKVYSLINWERTSGSKISFTNTSEIIAMSASEASQSEGWHFHCVVLDECHKISDTVVSQRLLPMLGSFSIAKIIKIGISMYKNNFWKSCCSPNTPYVVLSKDWTQCPILLSQGSILYNGVEYSKYVLDRMPLSMKQRVFPDRPDLHFDGDLTELDFKTQYTMEWVNDINLVLNEEEQKKLLSGTHEILPHARKELQEQYYFGLDTASGTLLPGKKDLDFTVLSIWRKNQDNSKDKVACYEWQGQVAEQVEEIKQIINPETGIFPCVFGLADYSNIAISLVEFFKKDKIPIDGIMFNSTEPATRKNYKNAMFDEFVFELQSGRILFPSLDKIDQHIAFKKSFNEWCAIERHRKLGINDSISSPSDFHDDHPCADVLAVFAIDRAASFSVVQRKLSPMPDPIGGEIQNLAGRMIPFPKGSANRSRYLGGPS